ncbi:5,10-methylenetetrahydrofolate reductase (NAD(P)) [Mariprofundus ferrinatatus]|uniref:Methylenetetrahydrofolate reductase n=1 Tax=Mariprofundus ferrinatatus TaxID=1921087 RepID=A0A2K8LA35_9PROT|nr:methylenetetrahydrofolate reductase [NAD(P)H] [Mariprofundus ferrinatatus]ATX81136.1 5,10-methylenetetrahydrofolate reductase (NAD(P)) [Mariprofundus ferrinatatus]
MKLSEILSSANKPLFSCEFFPPKTDKGEENLWNCLRELQAVNPAYVSVTYGAGGTTQDRTKGIVTRIKDETGLSPVAHLTCVGATKEQLGELLADYQAAGIQNILALRGDAPEGMDRFEAVAGGFSHATDLIAFLREQGDFSIACATYPEGHPESKGGVRDDIRYLKMKQDNGADCAITQYFFDNEAFFRFRDSCDAAGITMPIIPGIMPIGNFDQIVRFSSMCGATIPAWLHEQMSPISDNPDAVAGLGIELAVKQCAELLENGAPGLHIYTLNKSAASIAIHERIRGYL